MSQGYYAIENRTNLGEQNIGLQVIETIVKETVDKLEGASLESNNALSMKSKGPIIVTVNKNNQIGIDIDITIDYGMNVGTTSSLIQDTVIAALSQMLEIKNAMININVQKINF
jgi:uncharacterized alkaline shock family protein YloU